jgi:hypothetical protein
MLPMPARYQTPPGNSTPRSANQRHAQCCIAALRMRIPTNLNGDSD